MATEQEVSTLLGMAGWRVQHGGWPDFLCWKEDRAGNMQAVCVEVKNKDTNDTLRSEQHTAHRILRGLNVPVYVVGSAEDLLTITPPPVFLADTDVAQRLALAERSLREYRLSQIQAADDEIPYTIAEAAKRLGVSRQTAKRIFDQEPGVLRVVSRSETMHKGSYNTTRIPRALFRRVVERMKQRTRTRTAV